MPCIDKVPGAVVLVLSFLCAFTYAATASTNHHVILITIDGLAAYNLSDPHLPMPTLRKLAAEGAVAEGMRVSNPSVTWPNHTTLVTGVHADKHSVLFNGALVRLGPGDSVGINGARDKGDLVAVPTIYDLLHRVGYRTANVNWPCTRGAKTLDDNFPDVPQEINHLTPRLRVQLIAAGILPDANPVTFRRLSAAARDQAWTATAVHLIQTRRPNLLLLHLLVADSMQHLYGPRSPGASTAFALADANLADVLRALTMAGIRDRTTVFITSDHGFERVTKLVNPNVVFRKAGMFRSGPRRRAQSLAEGGTALVYLTAPETIQEDRGKVISLLHEHEGIAEIIGPERFAALHLPDPAKNPQMSDLILVAKEGYAFSDEFYDDNSVTELKMPGGSHGNLSTDSNMNGVFIASGRGIKAGVKLGIVDIIDVAPTVAAILGEQFSSADGKIIREILTEPPP
ncbi:MAG: alkaline phosphatase family protein [Verrucomicrobia bacterium]|nr:alkaline phosphatase family protein [Verrucomicrobiota bacterium]